MERGVIRARVRTELHEPTAGAWSDEQLNVYINDSAKEFASDSGILLTEPVQTGIVSGTAAYSLPVDCPGVHALRLVYYDTNLLDASDPVAIAQQDGNPHTDSGTPTKHYGINVGGIQYIVLYPIPGAALTNGLKIWYWKLASDMTADTSVCDIPDEYMKGVMAKATEYAFLSRRELTMAQAQQGIYADYVERAKTYVDAVVTAIKRDRDASAVQAERSIF